MNSSSQHGDITNPKYIGPGTWHVIHSQAILARDDKSEDEFIKLIKSICNNFGCPVCKIHCKEYIENNPPEKLKGVKIKIGNETLLIGMFFWTFQFHNVVNQRLGKPIMSFENAYKLFNNENCSNVCTASV